MKKWLNFGGVQCIFPYYLFLGDKHGLRYHIAIYSPIAICGFYTEK